jgi:hypothetical protein
MTDAVVLVVSEETGKISIVKGGKIEAKIDPQNLNNKLNQALDEFEEEKGKSQKAEGKEGKK